MARMLEELGYEYEEQVRVEGHKVDFLVEGVVVEANGDWWHSTEMWKKTDAKKLKTWREAGVRFVGVWESRMYRDALGVMACLKAVIEEGVEPWFWDWAVDDPREKTSA